MDTQNTEQWCACQVYKNRRLCGRIRAAPSCAAPPFVPHCAVVVCVAIERVACVSVAFALVKEQKASQFYGETRADFRYPWEQLRAALAPGTVYRLTVQAAVLWHFAFVRAADHREYLSTRIRNTALSCGSWNCCWSPVGLMWNVALNCGYASSCWVLVVAMANAAQSYGYGSGVRNCAVWMWNAVLHCAYESDCWAFVGLHWHVTLHRIYGSLRVLSPQVRNMPLNCDYCDALWTCDALWWCSSFPNLVPKNKTILELYSISDLRYGVNVMKKQSASPARNIASCAAF